MSSLRTSRNSWDNLEVIASSDHVARTTDEAKETTETKGSEPLNVHDICKACKTYGWPAVVDSQRSA